VVVHAIEFTWQPALIEGYCLAASFTKFDFTQFDFTNFYFEERGTAA